MGTPPAADVAKKFAEQYKGKKWRTSDKAADWFQYGEAVSIRFFASNKKLRDFLIDGYSDYLVELKWCAYDDKKGVKWSREDIVPIAAVADADSDADNEEFMEEATGFLFYDGEKHDFVYANSDEFSLENRIKSLDKLGLNQNAPGDDMR